MSVCPINFLLFFKKLKVFKLTSDDIFQHKFRDFRSMMSLKRHDKLRLSNKRINEDKKN